MKTIYTSLPIYNSLAKQCFERGKRGGFDVPVPIVCPRHKLPAFQWNAESDDMGDVIRIEACTKDYNGTETAFTSTWVDTGFDTFTDVGMDINSAIVLAGGAAIAQTATNLSFSYGQQIRVRGTFTLNTGTGPVIHITDAVPAYSAALATGEVDLVFTAIANRTDVKPVIYLAAGPTNFSFTGVTITVIQDAVGVGNFMQDLPTQSVLTSDTYYSYNGEVLEYNMPPGIYYLKITMENAYILYSEWFRVDCVYTNLISSWTNGADAYDTFAKTETKITTASNAAGTAEAYTDTFSVIKGEVVTVRTFLTLNSGELPFVYLYGTVASASINMVEGINEIDITPTETGDVVLYIANTDASGFNTSEVFVTRQYSDKYITLEYSNDCDLGNILYSDGLEQTVWFESETMEPTFPQEEQGMNNGDGKFVRSFARQVKKYTARTKEMPDFMVEVFNRMKLHDNILLIDLVGNSNYVYNLEVNHEWLGNDKYYAKIDLIFDYDEAFVIAGCCNNLT